MRITITRGWVDDDDDESSDAVGIIVDMINTIRDYIAAHRKALLVALGAVLVLVVDAETADEIVGAATVVLTILVPNDQAAVDRVYHRRR